MRKGFTLIELLIVIGIIAILAVAVILVLNPTQLLKEGRDSTRMSDMATLNSAIALYLADQTPSSSSWNQIANCARTSITGGVGVPKTNTTTSACTASSSQVTTGAGWIPIDFSSITGGTVINKLPVDPTGVGSGSDTGCTGTLTHCVYIYRSSTTVGRYLLETNMESTKYSTNGTKDVESTDGGVITEWFEMGSNLATSTF